MMIAPQLQPPASFLCTAVLNQNTRERSQVKSILDPTHRIMM